MNHFITLNKAIEMTTFYRNEKENILADSEKGKQILPVCETFEAASVTAVLNQPGCVSLRIYFGMNADKKSHAIIVGVNSRGEDILPVVATTADDSYILEEAVRCPVNCPPPSVLNP